MLGVSVFRQDCGAVCAFAGIAGTYYGCSGSACNPVAVAVAKQLQNPVALFAQDNNGLIVDLPAVPAEGAATHSGSLIFGIGTQTNNGLGGAVVMPVEPSNGTFTTLYANRSYTGSFIDSGSNAMFFNDGISTCRQAFSSGYYCPATTQTLSAQNQGRTGVGKSVSFSVANAEELFLTNPGNKVFGNLAGPRAGSSFDWGLPFFFGHRVYVAFEGTSTPGGSGPYFAY